MPEDRLHYMILSDGKPGHENQSRGLAEALQRRTGGMIHCVKVEGVLRTAKELRRRIEANGSPRFLIGAGRRTHLALLYSAWRFGVESIVLMKPGFPMKWFTWCVVPWHDLPKAKERKGLIISVGALNRIQAFTGQKKGKLVLIGGPSSAFHWDAEGLIAQLKAIGPGLVIADSRRTPEGFLETAREKLEECEVASHEKVPEGWLQDQFRNMAEIHVTEDSVSMVYEALSSGARVHLLKMQGKGRSSRVVRGLKMLREKGYFAGEAMPALAEADRCAGVILGNQTRERRSE